MVTKKEDSFLEIESSEKVATVVAAPGRQWDGFDGAEGTKFRNSKDAWDEGTATTDSDPVWLPIMLEYAYNKQAPGCFGRVVKGHRYWKYSRIPDIHRGSKKTKADSDRVRLVMQDLEIGSKATPEIVASLMNQETRLLHDLVDRILHKQVIDAANVYGMLVNRYYKIATTLQLGKSPHDVQYRC
jgi:hypothetical protein